MSGAVEGFLEGLERYDPASAAKESIREAGTLTRSATEAAKAEADTPEMKELGQDLRRVGDRVGERVSDASYTVKQGVDDVRQRVHEVREEIGVRASAVRESSRRAAQAPKRVGAELRQGARAWWRGLKTAMAMGLAMAVLAVVTLVVLTIALVVGLNALLGDPAGTFVVAGLYALAVLVAYGIMRGAKTKASRETAYRMERSREEIRRVGEPVREAFSGRGRRPT